MPNINIMHIDREYQVFVMAIDNGSSSLKKVTLNEALDLMHSQQLDLIVSEPQQKAIFDKPIVPASPQLRRPASIG